MNEPGTNFSGNEDSRRGFTGHQIHRQSGLLLAPYRAYDPGTGRWLSEDPIGLRDGPNRYAYVNNRVTAMHDEHGMFGALPAIIARPVVVLIVQVIAWAIGNQDATRDDGLTFAQQTDAKAPGKPSTKDGFVEGKDGAPLVKNPNGPGYGWRAKDGNVWCPTGPRGHGGPHWDVQRPGGGYDNVYPGGRIRPGS